MAYVMRYETWMDLTALSMKPRSKELKAIDGALKQYHKTSSEGDLRRLKLALHHWKMSKGFDGTARLPAWKTSERNRKKAIETLDLQIFGVQDPQAQQALAMLAELPFYGIEAWAGEEAAKEALRQARDEALSELFAGKNVAFKQSELALAANFMKRKISAVQKNAGEAASAAAGAATRPVRDAVNSAVGPLRESAEKAVLSMIQEVLGQFPITVAQEVMRFLAGLIPNFVAEIAAAVAPYLSIARSGAKAVQNTGQAVVKEYQWVQAGNHAVGFGVGDPLAAAAAIRRIIERERNQHMRLAGLYTTDATVKAAAVAADAAAFGAPTVSAVVTPLQGMATALAVLSLQIYLIARDFHEMYKANQILAQRHMVKLSSRMFDSCPLTGCYFIACSNTSDLINFLVEDLGSPGWKLDVEVMVKQHVHPMVGYARSAISSSRLEVPGLEMSKGVVIDASPGLLNTHNRLKAKMIRKINSALPWREDLQNYETFAAKQGQQVVGKDVLKSRIQGFGPGGK